MTTFSRVTGSLAKASLKGAGVAAVGIVATVAIEAGVKCSIKCYKKRQNRLRAKKLAASLGATEENLIIYAEEVPVLPPLEMARAEIELLEASPAPSAAQWEDMMELVAGLRNEIRLLELTVKMAETPSTPVSTPPAPEIETPSTPEIHEIPSPDHVSPSIVVMDKVEDKIAPYIGITDVTRQVLARFEPFPEVPAGKLTHPHPDEALFRAFFENRIYHLARKEADIVGAMLADVGANYTRHEKFGRRIHCVTPILDRADKLREESRQKLKASPGYVACETVTRCAHRFEECVCLSEKCVLMLIDVIYYIKLIDIVRHVREKGSVYAYGHLHQGKSHKAMPHAKFTLTPITGSTNKFVTVKITGNDIPYKHAVFDWTFSELPDDLIAVSLVPESWYADKDYDQYAYVIKRRNVSPPTTPPAPENDVPLPTPPEEPKDLRLPQHNDTNGPADLWAAGEVEVKVAGETIRVPQALIDQCAIFLMQDSTDPAWTSRVQAVLKKAARHYNAPVSEILNPRMVESLRALALEKYAESKKLEKSILEGSGGAQKLAFDTEVSRARSRPWGSTAASLAGSVAKASCAVVAEVSKRKATGVVVGAVAAGAGALFKP